MKATQILEKKLFSALQNLIDESADSRLNWNGIVSKFYYNYFEITGGLCNLIGFN